MLTEIYIEALLVDEEIAEYEGRGRKANVARLETQYSNQFYEERAEQRTREKFGIEPTQE